MMFPLTVELLNEKPSTKRSDNMSFFKKLFGKKKKSDSKEKEKKQPGSITIIDNEVTIKNPILCNDYARIFIHEDERLTVTVDGEPMTGEVTLSEEHTVKIQIDDAIIDEPGTTFSTRVSSTKLYAYLKKTVTKGKCYGIENVENAQKVEVKLSEQSYSPVHIPIDYLKEQLNEYEGEINEDNLEAISTSNETIEEIAIEGVTPIDPIPSYYKLVFDIKDINYIHKGEKIAEFVSRVEGKPGRDIFGNEIVIDIPDELPVIKENVEKREDYLYAKIDGRVVFSDEEIEVYPQLLIPRDLTEEDGDIIFNEGDVVIEGSIMDKCFIKAKGMVVVKGGAHHSDIFSEHGVFIHGNVSKSFIYSGWVLFYRQLAKDFSDALSDFEQTYQNIQEKFDNQSDKKNELINTLLKDKYDQLEKMIERMTVHNRESIKKYNDGFEEIIDYFNEHWHNKRLTLKQEKIDALKETIRQFLKINGEDLWEEPSKIEAKSVSSSELYATGDIEIKGNGIYMAHVECGNKVLIHQLLTGGTIIAENEVEIGEYKSFNTNEFFVHVKNQEEGIISIQKMNPDSKVSIGKFEELSFDLKRSFKLSGKEETARLAKEEAEKEKMEEEKRKQKAKEEANKKKK